jgi:signal transduction histidine kinase
MEAIVGKMLLLARAEHQEEWMGAPGVVLLATVVRGVAEELAPMAEARGVSVTVAPDEEAVVAGEAGELRLVCANLLQNAIQHSVAGALVRVGVRRAGDMVELCVEDHGSGVEAVDLPHVFERFYRGDTSRSRHTGGTGLGLAISKAIVMGLGGTIAMESVVGLGTTVMVRLPRVQS